MLTLKIYFLQECEACNLFQENLIKKILNQGQMITVYVEYYEDCSLAPIVVGSTLMTLNNDINNDQISGPTQSMFLHQLKTNNEICF